MAKIFGGKATLWRANTAAVGETNFTQVAQVTDLAESGGESAMITTTNRDDLMTSLAEVQQPGLIAPVSLDFTVQFDGDLVQHTGMLTDAETQVERNFQVRVTGMTNRFKYRGFQKALPRTYEMANLIMSRTGVACSTRPTIAP
jgi:hypothetical protein